MSNAFNEKPNAEPLPAVATVGVTVNGPYSPRPEDKDGKLWVRTTALILADAEELYRMWRDVENAPLWQEQIEKVIRTGDTTSHWVMRSGDQGKTIEWDSKVLMDEPGRRINTYFDLYSMGKDGESDPPMTSAARSFKRVAEPMAASVSSENEAAHSLRV